MKIKKKKLWGVGSGGGGGVGFGGWGSEWI